MTSPSRRLADTDARVAQLKSDLVVVQQENQSLLDHRRALFTQLSTLQENYNTLQDQLSNLQNDYQHVVTTNRKTVEESERKYVDVVRKCDEQSSQLGLLEHVVSMKQSEIDSLNQQVQGLQVALNERHVVSVTQNNENEAVRPPTTESTEAYTKLLQNELIEVKKSLHAAEAAARGLQLEKLNWQSRQMNLELVYEEKRTLESKLEQLALLQDLYTKLELDNKQLQQQQAKWLLLTNGEQPESFLGNMKDVKFKLTAAEETIHYLQNEVQTRTTMLQNRQTIIDELNAKNATLTGDLNNAKQTIAKLESLRKVSDRQVELYKTQLKSYDEEEKMYSDKYDQLKDARIQQLEQQIECMKNELVTNVQPVLASSVEPDKTHAIYENEKKMILNEKELLAKELIETRTKLEACVSECQSLKTSLFP